MVLHNSLQPLRDLDGTSTQFHDRLIDFLSGNEYRDTVPSLRGGDLAWLVEYLDTVLCGTSDSTAIPFLELLHELRRICGVKEVLPKSCTLSDSLLGSVYEGTFRGSKVRIRRVKIYSTEDSQKVRETFRQVAVAWKYLEHPNIVPLLGVTTDPPQFISDWSWMTGGCITEYIVNNPEADRLSLLSNVAEGLNYLHSHDVIHGDLKGSNVLVDPTGHARITDFGLASVTHNLDSIQEVLDEYDHSARWIAPEILDNRGTFSKEGDVFSFAMLTIEVFTGAVPFSDRSPHMAMLAIVGGERPPRPTHPALTDRLWALTQRCWDQEARRRPQVLQISCCLGVPAWKRLIDRTLAKDERISLITALLFERDETEAIKRLPEDDAQFFVDVLDETLDSLARSLRRKCLAALCRICSHHALLPTSVQIPLCYDRTDAPLYHGGFAEVWKGEHQGREVAVKVIKIYKTSDLAKITRRFCKEVVTWKALRHQNVLPLLGVTMSNSRFAMVSEWMHNGNINEFVKTHRDANRFELLKDVACGLIYMHGQVMVHGDLKGANIMIDNGGRARLADFGLLTIVSDSTHPATSSSSKNAGTTRWMSPELLDPDKFGFKNSRPTKESDCYALGMVILEVLTGQVPFSRCNNLVAMRKVVDGERPERSQGPESAWFTDDLWGMLEQCWAPEPELRPTVEAIFDCLEQGSTAWQPLSPIADADLGADEESVFTVSYFPSGETVSYNGDQSPVLLQSHLRDVGMGQGPPRSSLGTQLQDESYALPETASTDRLEPVRPYKSAYHSEAPTDPPWNHTITRKSESDNYGKAYQFQPEHGAIPDPYVSEKVLPSSNDLNGGRNIGGRRRKIGDVLGTWPETSQSEGRHKNLPRLPVDPGAPRSRKRRPSILGPLFKPAVQSSSYPPVTWTPQLTNLPNSPNVYSTNRAGVSSEDLWQPELYERFGDSSPDRYSDESAAGSSSSGHLSAVSGAPELSPATLKIRNARGKMKRNFSERVRAASPDEEMQRLFRECKIARGHAVSLAEAVIYTRPEGMKEKEVVIEEFCVRCRASLELLYSRIPPATSHAARSRNSLRVASGEPVDHKESNVLDLRRDPSELTVEERLLAAMLVSNEELTESLRMYDGWKTDRYESSAGE